MVRVGLVVLLVAFSIYLVSNLLTSKVVLERAQASFNERAAMIERVLEESK